MDSRDYKLRTPRQMCADRDEIGHCVRLDEVEQDRWMTDRDLERVMAQLLRLVPRDDVYFEGTLAMDIRRAARCTCERRERLHTAARRVLEVPPPPKARSVGLIFNTCDHDGEGEHWVALSLEPSNARAIYYDSLGHAPPDEIVYLVERVGSNAGLRYDLVWNEREHQRRGGECGMFCCNFLLSRFMGTCFERFCEQQWTHADMLYLRILVFGPVWRAQFRKEFGHHHIPDALRDSLDRYRLVFRNTDIDASDYLYMSAIRTEPPPPKPRARHAVDAPWRRGGANPRPRDQILRTRRALDSRGGARGRGRSMVRGAKKSTGL